MSASSEQESAELWISVSNKSADDLPGIACLGVDNEDDSAESSVCSLFLDPTIDREDYLGDPIDSCYTVNLSSLSP